MLCCKSFWQLHTSNPLDIVCFGALVSSLSMSTAGTYQRCMRELEELHHYTYMYIGLLEGPVDRWHADLCRLRPKITQIISRIVQFRSRNKRKVKYGTSALGGGHTVPWEQINTHPRNFKLRNINFQAFGQLK